ncbi:MAG: 3'(2'),5'-bisphosphate nucleotidase CysQ, partial [Pseudomonadota bacterium]|nr:3'(2'),5'-bisphosphate nucleotidase CysQ [Pseudomonadota bacterium]
FGGIVGLGAWKRTAGRETPVSARAPSPDGLVVLASRYHADHPRLSAFLERHHVAQVINFGSSVKFCRLAEGRADLYPRFGRTMEWDTAAPQALLEAAGGAVRTMEGEKLHYGKPGWDNPSFVCSGRPGSSV